jgi:hypothetical protein
MLAATLDLPPAGSLPLDRFLAPLCTIGTAIIILLLYWIGEWGRSV